MADNKILPLTGSGATTLTVATDEVSGVDFQLMKLVDGTADSSARIGGDATNGLDVDVTRLPALIAGTAVIGNVGLAPRTTGGLSISRVVSGASTNATNIKTAAGQVYGWYLSNLNASARYVKLYNKSGVPTVGTDTPAMTLLVPAGGAANCEFANGIAFATGIALATTTGALDADTGAVAAGELIAHILFA